MGGEVFDNGRRSQFFPVFPSPDVAKCSLKKHLNASRPSEHLTGGKNVKTLRWDHRLLKQNLVMAFKRVPRW